MLKQTTPKCFVLCVFLVLPLVSGCASIINGTKDTVQISANYNLPPSVEVADIELSVAGQDLPPGGGVVILQRGSSGSPVRAKCTKPGYTVTASPSLIQPSFGVGWFIWELFLPPGLLGIIVDFSTGAYWNYPDMVGISVTVTPVRREEP